MGVLAARALPAGHVLAHSDFAYAFPTVGVGAEDQGQLVGRVLKQSVGQGEPLHWSDVD